MLDVLGVLGELACLHASMLGVLACVRACYDEMFYFLTCLRTWCVFFVLLALHLNLKILTAKNLCALLS